jgi:hypothetical protein
MTEIVIVLSTLKPDPSPLSYAPRSVFTEAQRLEQTIKTLESVREKIPNAFILFVDATGIHLHIEKLCDSVYIPENSIAVHSPNKGWGEASLTIEALKWVSMAGMAPKRIWKLNGRYYLNENFSLEEWDQNKSQAHFYNKSSCCTVLYTISAKDSDTFKKFAEDSAKFLKNNPGVGMETVWSRFPFSHISHLGVSGKVSVSGEDWSR